MLSLRPTPWRMTPPSFGEHFVLGHDVWIAGVLGETVVDHRSMSVAHREGGRVRGDAVPDQLDDAQPLLDRKLEDFRDVGTAHVG